LYTGEWIDSWETRIIYPAEGASYVGKHSQFRNQPPGSDIVARHGDLTRGRIPKL